MATPTGVVTTPINHYIHMASCSSSVSAVSTSAASINSFPNIKKRILVWCYFSPGPQGDDKAICDTCGEHVATSGNTTNITTVSQQQVALLIMNIIALV